MSSSVFCAEAPREHADLPSTALIRGTALVVVVLFLLEQMRLALQGEADALDARRREADNDAQLQRRRGLAWGWW